MSYQLSDIRTKVQLRIRDTGYSTTEITNYLNDTLNDIFNEYRLPFMETTQNYTLTLNVSDITNGSNVPTNYAQAIDLFNTYNGNEYLLPYRDIRDIDFLYTDPDDATVNPAGPPQYWYFYANVPHVFPQPDKAYTLTLRYYKKPTMLSADADVPSVPSQFEELLVMGAAFRIMQVKDNYDEASVLENKYMELLQKLVMQNAQAQIGSPHRMRINRQRVSGSPIRTFRSY